MRLWSAAAAIAASFVASAGHAQTEDWAPVTRHNGSAISIDRNSVERQGGYVSVISRSMFDEIQPGGAKMYRVRYRYDCTNRTSDLLYFEIIDAGGRIIAREEVEPENREVEPVPADSPNEAILALLCA